MAEVKVQQGVLRGRHDDGVFAFLGVPYAAAPFGARRMQAPVPPAAWDGVREALEFGPTAPAPPYPSPLDTVLYEPVIDGDDCLNLNVWTPETGAGGLPVFVWIHGGGFTNGSGGVVNGSAFARGGVVCVTINYRLGVDGFLFTGQGPVNLGLLDQVAALEWVQDNIAAFGGDPGKVTIGGESAGAMSVTTLMAMPKARGLFRRVVAQSGAGHHALSPATAARVAGYLAEDLGVEATHEALGRVPLDQLIAAHSALAAETQTDPDPQRWGEILQNLMVFEPVIDGAVLPRLPIEELRAGASSTVDLLIGTNAEEFGLFLVPSGAWGFVDDAMVDGAAAAYGLPAAALDAYRKNRPGAPPAAVLNAVGTDFFFRVPAIRAAEARFDGPGPTYLYEFTWRSPQFDGKLGACHAAEIPFVFDDLAWPVYRPLIGADPPQSVADTMHAAWVRFVTTGDPGWSPYTAARRSVMRFDVDSGVVDDPRAEERRLWEGVR
ncbi:MAG TPA: carboxylesterase family protein [Acidimicrobiales bacterium]